MNSIISEDLSREHLALDAAKCVEYILARTQSVTSLHKELAEINLSVTAYIEESKHRLESLRLSLAQEAKSAKRVVKILSEKSLLRMSISPASHKQMAKSQVKSSQEDNNNTSDKFCLHQQARSFIQWYRHMMDNDRQHFPLYLADDAVLEWFGKTIKTKKKVSTFLKYDMQCSKHDFTTIESIDKIITRQEKIQRNENTTLLSPLTSPELIKTKIERPCKRRLTRSNCSPQWADGCDPNEITVDRKRLKMCHLESMPVDEQETLKSCDVEMNSKGDGNKKIKSKNVHVTPPNLELGQGDCLPSTSGTDSNKSPDTMDSQFTKLAVECNGYIQFARTRNNRSTESMKWDRKCKVQISYSEDPLNAGEYIIWYILYSDESKCRRNLLAAFEEVATEENANKT